MRPIIAAATLALAFGAADAGAIVLYKLTDANGHVTYTDTIPRGWSGAVTRLDIEPDASTVAPARIPEILGSAPAAPVAAVPRSAASIADERLRLARSRVDAARAALADAQANSTAEDWHYFGPNNPLGMRRAPRPEYAERLQRLEGDVLEAEEALARLERELR